ncbi:MAG: TetR/AcrR family transcriptional regulator, partial [Henriciella sp.]|nr:TetR/AcrR family transcriptional regulator [Henriciella sp.]
MRERKMAEVLFGAREVFFRCGYEGATVDAIAAEGKVSKATMYSYFPTKEQLFLSVVESECGRLAEEILRPLSAGPEPRAQLEKLALRLGYASSENCTASETFLEELAACTQKVRKTFLAVLAEESNPDR